MTNQPQIAPLAWATLLRTAPSCPVTPYPGFGGPHDTGGPTWASSTGANAVGRSILFARNSRGTRLPSWLCASRLSSSSLATTLQVQVRQHVLTQQVTCQSLLTIAGSCVRSATAACARQLILCTPSLQAGQIVGCVDVGTDASTLPHARRQSKPSPGTRHILRRQSVLHKCCCLLHS